MSLEQNKDVVRHFVAEFKNKGNFAIVDELFTVDFVHHIAMPGLPPGRDGMKAVGQAVYAAFPDVHVDIQQLIAEGDFVVEKTVAKATHKGELGGIPPSGNPITWSETNIWKIQAGKIAEFRPETDLMASLLMGAANS